MIDVWILTVVIGNVFGLTSFQLKFYSQYDAKAEMNHHRGQHNNDYFDAFITKTQEQKIN